MKYLKKFEAFGVPDGILESANNLYDRILENLERISNYKLSSLQNINSSMQIHGDFIIGDNLYKRINIHWNVLGIMQTLVEDGEEVSIKNNGMHVSRDLSDDKKNEIDITIKLLINDRWLELTELIKKLKDKKDSYVSILSHELKHHYDNDKNPKMKFMNMDYYTVSELSNKTGFSVLDNYLWMYYYIHNTESLVRTSEMASIIKSKNISKKYFKRFLKRTELYIQLNHIRSYTLKDLKSDMKRYSDDMDDWLIINFPKDWSKSNVYKSPMEEKIDFCLRWLYKTIAIVNKNYIDSILKSIDDGFKDTLFSKHKDYSIKSLERGKKKLDPDADHKKFFKNQEKFFYNKANKTIKKLAGLYDMCEEFNIDDEPILSNIKNLLKGKKYHIEEDDSVISVDFEFTKDGLDYTMVIQYVVGENMLFMITPKTEMGKDFKENVLDGSGFKIFKYKDMENGIDLLKKILKK